MIYNLQKKTRLKKQSDEIPEISSWSVKYSSKVFKRHLGNFQIPNNFNAEMSLNCQNALDSDS